MSGKPAFNIVYCKELAKKRGGKCLDNTYINIFGKLQWKCRNGHVWVTSLNCVKNKGSWCPICAKKIFIGQELCRKVFEHVFNDEFSRGTPVWLVNPTTKRRLELDGYNQKLKIAFEYQGRQHYKKLAYMTDAAFNKVKIRDLLKVTLCKENNINLFIIPYIDVTTNPVYLTNHFKKYIGKLANSLKSKDIRNFLSCSFPDKIVEAEDYANKINLEFLGIKNKVGKYKKVWLGSSAHHWYRCTKCGKTWKKTPRKVRIGQSCRGCITRKRNERDLYSYEEAKIVVRKFNMLSSSDYRKRCKLDHRLPTNPRERYTYKKCWLGWEEFLFSTME